MKFNPILSVTITQKLNISFNNFLKKTCHWMVLFTCVLKNPPAMWETWVWPLGWEDSLEKGMATHSSILAWRIPWTVWSMGSQRLRHDWATFTFTFFFKSLQSCQTLCDPMYCNLQGSSVHGILQARILEWVAMPFHRGSSRPGDRTHVSYVSCIGSWVLLILNYYILCVW